MEKWKNTVSNRSLIWAEFRTKIMSERIVNNLPEYRKCWAVEISRTKNVRNHTKKCTRPGSFGIFGLGRSRLRPLVSNRHAKKLNFESVYDHNYNSQTDSVSRVKMPTYSFLFFKFMCELMLNSTELCK